MPPFLSGYSDRVKVTIKASKVPSTQTDFPVYVDLADMPANFWSIVASGGGDIRVTRDDGVTECPREVVSCDTTAETGELHFLANSVSGSSDTDFYIYVNGTNADYAVTDTYGRNAVWSDYLVVFHMKDATSTIVSDSAGNFDITKASSGNPFETTGKVREAQSLSTATSRLSTSQSSAINTRDAKSIQMWLNIINTTDPRYYFGIASGVNSTTSDTRFRLNSGNITFQQFDGAGKEVAVVSSPSTGVWYHIVGTYDGTNMRGYANGSLTNTIASGLSFNHGANALLQLRDSNNTSSFLADEARFRKSVLSADWITTEYNNQSDASDFYDTTFESSVAPPVTANNGFALWYA
jgi:hypothetical protein